MLFPGHPWFSVGTIPTLSEGHVHVWRARLDQGSARLGQLACTLCEAERRRADRFFFERDKNRFIACRGTLREILGGYVGVAPSRIGIRYGRHGKPYLAERLDGGALRFNLSHSGDMAVLAFARGRDIGIDLERVRADFPWDEIQQQVFSHRESSLLRDLPETARSRMLFAAWTCKEAYVKAKGRGLSFALDQIDVSLSPLALRRITGDEHEASRWSLQEIEVGGDYAAAVVVEGHGWRLLCGEWS